MDDFATGYLAGQDGGNNSSGFFGNEGLWAVIILAIIFGWGTNGYGRNGGDNSMNSYIPYLVGTGATGQGGADTRAALSEGFYQQDTSRSLAGIQSGICSLGYDQLAQMNGVNTNIANGFAGVNSAICQLGYQNAQLVNAWNAACPTATMPSALLSCRKATHGRRVRPLLPRSWHLAAARTSS